MEDKRPTVVFFQRKARSVGNYSVEFIFEDVRERLKNKIEALTFFSKHESTGLFKRIYNCVEAAFNQASVNHVTGDVNYIGLLLSKNKTIHTILDCVFIASTQGVKRFVLKTFWLTIPVKRAKFVTAISEATKREILKYVNCNPDKIVVIPVAISERFKRADKAFNENCPIILQIGTAPNKNIPRLIEALKGVNCCLHIVGKQNDEYESLLKKYNIPYVYQWGLSDLEIIKKYEEADIISLVSTYEGFGMPILEAQAIGRPVITSNILSMPEVAGNAASLVDPFNIDSIKEGIITIIENKEYRNSLIEKGFHNIKRFNPEAIATKYFELYQKISAQ